MNGGNAEKHHRAERNPADGGMGSSRVILRELFQVSVVAWLPATF
jgi:hypothetical protein